MKTYANPERSIPEDIPLSEDEIAEINDINNSIFTLYFEKEAKVTLEDILRKYIQIRRRINARGVPFGLVNNRLYLGDDKILIPYLIGSTILNYHIPVNSSMLVSVHTLRPGLIITDDLLLKLVAFDGKPLDLEELLFELDVERVKTVRIVHIRDMTTQLEKMAYSVNRADATYLLHTIVAQTSLLSFKEYLSAKNLQLEVRRLHIQLLNFLNSPLSYQLPFLVRILVRNISGVVAKPKLIDRLWNDTIELAEVYLIGSNIVNEIRRSTHHAVGKRTLSLVQAYLEYLDTGNTDKLEAIKCPQISMADMEARKKPSTRKIVARIHEDLKELMGRADVIGHINDWRKKYSATLLQCESDRDIEEEASCVINDGLREKNRWTFYHHLRFISSKVRKFSLLKEEKDTVLGFLEKLQTLKPDEDDFDLNDTEAQLSEHIGKFIQIIRSRYEHDLYQSLDELAHLFKEKAFYKTFVNICKLRKKLRVGLSEGAFPEQRLLLFELDCLLEEMGYVSLRHVASYYEDNGVDLLECIDVMHWCALNLTHDGLYSRQLLDLVGILTDHSYTYAEVTNVLRQVQHNYQHILRQLTLPFEKIQDQVEFDKERLRTVLANMQRFLHDLNSVAYFTDLALSHIEHHIVNIHEPLNSNILPNTKDDDEDNIIHFFHHEDIHSLIGEVESPRSLRALYGGKGSGLVYISYLNIPMPDGFIIPTTIARRRTNEKDDKWLDEMVRHHLSVMEKDISRVRGVEVKFGDSKHPLILAARGGSVFSMPGILSTVLFVGINDDIAETLAKTDPWHAYDSYRRFLASYGNAVWHIDVEKYNLVEEAKSKYGVKYKDALGWEAMKDIVEATKEVFRSEGYGEELDEILKDPYKQLINSVRAVLDSWDHPTTKRYRELKDIRDTWQTAVIIQEMVSGNRRNEPIEKGMDESKASLTGVIPRTRVNKLGVRKCTGEFKFSACGEDLVAGLTTSVSFMPFDELGVYMPMLNRKLNHTVMNLRRFMGTDQEIEFTVDRGVLSVLQTRASEIGANKHSYAFIEPGSESTRGLGIRGSAFRGLAAFDEEDFNELAKQDLSGLKDVDGILMILENPSPQEIPLVLQADGLLASKGGSTSHAAVAVCSIENKDYSAVMSTANLQVDAQKHHAIILDDQGEPEIYINKGDIVSIHGSSGMVFVGSRQIVPTTAIGNA